MKNTEITNTEDIIDSRDVIARIEELRGEFEALRDAVTEAEDEESTEDARDALAEWLGVDALNLPADVSEMEPKGYASSDESTELVNLEALASEAEGSGDWHHGETLIRDSYFEDYARELAEDCCDMPKDARWPMCHIDWPAAADALKADYTSVSFDGVDYWIRA